MAPMDFLSSNVEYNNLNGEGPTTTDPTQVLLSNVGFTTPTSGAAMGMRIVSDSAYQAHRPTRNGPNAGGFLILNMRGEVDTILNFTFVDDNSQDPVTVPHFVISIYDLDRGCSGGAGGKTCDGGSFDLGEVVMAKSSTADPAQGFDVYMTSGGTSEAEIGAVTGGWTSFSATTAGTGADNPDAVQGLTEDQLNKAVSLYYSSTSSFELRFQVAFDGTLTNTGRNIFLSGVVLDFPGCPPSTPPSRPTWPSASRRPLRGGSCPSPAPSWPSAW